MFLAFIALIIRNELNKKLRQYLTSKRISLDSAINRLCSVRCRNSGDSWVLSSALTKTQREIVQILNVNFAKLANPHLKKFTKYSSLIDLQ